MQKATSGRTVGFGDPLEQPKTPSHVGAGFGWTRRKRPANLKSLPRERAPPCPRQIEANQGLASGHRVRSKRSASACGVACAAANGKQP